MTGGYFDKKSSHAEFPVVTYILTLSAAGALSGGQRPSTGPGSDPENVLGKLAELPAQPIKTCRRS